MRIAVISDTHDRLPHRVQEAVTPADAIWHLGDVCAPVVLEPLQKLGCPLHVVRGNCDDCSDWPESLDLDIEGAHIRLIHVPPRNAPAGFQFLLHGHTHVPRNELVGATRFLNPGCITRPNRGAPPSFGWLELKRGQPAIWSLVTL